MTKRWLKSFWQSVQKNWREGKKRKKTRKTIAKLFPLNANAINVVSWAVKFVPKQREAILPVLKRFWLKISEKRSTEQHKA